MKSHTTFRGVALSGALTLLHASAALAAGNPEDKRLHLNVTSTAHHATSSGASGSIVRTIVGLAIVIAVIYGLSWIIRQSKAAKNPAKGVGLEQIASLPLGTNRSVSLVRVGSEFHLLGVSESSVTTIRAFTEDEAIDAGLPVGPLDGDGDGDATAANGQPPLARMVQTLRRITVR
jgi:flagellar protein FliO/FliZ